MSDDLEIVAKLTASITEFQNNMATASNSMITSVNSMTGALSNLETSSGRTNSAVRQMGYNITSAVNNMASQNAAATQTVVGAINQMSATYVQASSAIQSTLQQLVSISQASMTSLNLNIQQTREELARLIQAQKGGPINPVAPEANNMLGALVSQMKGLLGTYLLFKGLKAFAGMAEEMEALHTRLDNVTGSSKKGAEAFKFITNEAMHTTANVNELVKTFIVMNNSGMKPMGGNFQSMLDIMAKYNTKADALSRVTMDISHAFNSGQIQLRTMNAMMNNGLPVWQALHEITGKNKAEMHELITQHKLGTEAMNQLIATMAKMSSGAAEAQMHTLVGTFSVLKDQVLLAADALNDAGAFEGFKQGIHDLINWMQKAREDGSMAEWAKNIGYNLTLATRAVEAIVDGFASVIGIITPLDESGNAVITWGDIVNGVFFAANMAVQEASALIQFAIVGIKFVLGELAFATVQAASVISRDWQKLQEQISTACSVVASYIQGVIAWTKALANGEGLVAAGRAWDLYKTVAVGAISKMHSDIDKLNKDFDANEKTRISGRILMEQDAANKIVAIAQKANTAIMTGTPLKPKSPDGKDNSNNNDAEDGAGKTGKVKSQMSLYQEQLSDLILTNAKKTAANNQFYGKEIQDSIKFWEDTKKIAGGKDLVEIQRKINHLKKQASDQSLTEMLNNLKAEEQAILYDFDKKLEIAEQERKMYADSPKEYAAATKHIEELNKLKAVQQQRIDNERLAGQRQMALDSVEIEKAVLDHEHDMRVISNKEYLQSVLLLAVKKKEIMLAQVDDEIRQERAKQQSNPVQLSALDTKKAKTETQGDAGILEAQHKLTQEMSKNWDKFSDSASTSFAKAADNIITLHKNVKDQGKQILAGMIHEEIQANAKILAQKTLTWARTSLLEATGQAKKTALSAQGAAARSGLVASEGDASILGTLKSLLFHESAETAKTTATTAGTGARVGEEIATSGTTLAIKIPEATTVIGAESAKAGAGAAAAVAPTPFVGPALAAAAFAATIALVLGAKSLLHAEGGFDIGNENPLTQLHKREMVLPQKYADTIRNMAENPRSPGKGNTHYHNTTVNVNGASDYDSFRRSQTQIQRAIKPPRWG